MEPKESTYWRKLKRAFNVYGPTRFGNNKDPAESTFTPNSDMYIGPSNADRPDRPQMQWFGDRTIITAIYNRIAIDAAMNDIRNVVVDEYENGLYIETKDTRLNDLFTKEANIDQNAVQFKIDLFLTMLEYGVAAIFPENTDGNMYTDDSYDVLTARVGQVMDWYPEHVKIRGFRQSTQTREEIILPKKDVVLIENPLYQVMNGPNSTLQRIIRVLNTLDVIDEQSRYGKLDVFVSLPYTIKSPEQQARANKRKAAIEADLRDSKYGIAYLDSTEKITQLNRPAENNLMAQYETLMRTLYSQLGLSAGVFEGTADEKEMNNYYQRTLTPILDSTVSEISRKWISRTAYSQGQRMQWFRDPFKFVPMTEMADLVDKLSRNEILAANEIRQSIGYPASADPGASELRNKNIRPTENEIAEETAYEDQVDYEDGLYDETEEV